MVTPSSWAASPGRSSVSLVKFSRSGSFFIFDTIGNYFQNCQLLFEFAEFSNSCYSCAMSINQPLTGSGSDENFDAVIGRRVHQMMWDQQMTQAVFANAIGMDYSVAVSIGRDTAEMCPVIDLWTGRELMEEAA